MIHFESSTLPPGDEKARRGNCVEKLLDDRPLKSDSTPKWAYFFLCFVLLEEGQNFNLLNRQVCGSRASVWLIILDGLLFLVGLGLFELLFVFYVPFAQMLLCKISKILHLQISRTTL